MVEKKRAIPSSSTAKTGKPRAKKAAKPFAVKATQVGTVPNGSLRDEIALLAYSYWEGRGCQGGSAEDDWLRAEQVVLGRRGSAADH